MAMRAESAGTVPRERRPELDAIRMLVVLGLVFFHAALVFAGEGDFYVRNAETTDVITFAAGFAVVWAMPALFLISGLGAWYSLARRGQRRFVRERLLRLGVPLLVVTVLLNPLPQWLRLRSESGGRSGAYDESYLRFLPRFYDVHLDLSEVPFVVQGEHFETGHMWFVVLLITFSLMLVPVVRYVPGARVRPVADRVAAAVVRRRGLILLPAAGLAVFCAFAGMEEDYAGWHRWAYLVFFAAGCALAADDRFRTVMRREAAVAGWLGVALFALSGVGFAMVEEPFTELTAPGIGLRTAFGAAGWCLVVAILGAADSRRLRAAEGRVAGAGSSVGWRARVYAYLGAAVLPLYALHQPLVVAAAYFVVGWPAPMAVEYAVIVTTSFAATLGAYELVVRRTRVTRVLFGMRGWGASPMRSSEVPTHYPHPS